VLRLCSGNRIGQYEVIPVPVSYETSEVGTFKLPPLPYRSRLVSARHSVTKALAATNAGTAVVKKGGTTIATVTVDASAAIGDEDAAPSVTEVIVDSDEQYTVTTAKGNAGGKGMLFLTVEILPSHS